MAPMPQPPPDRLPGTGGDTWLDPPHSTWAVWNLDQIAPCATVSAGPGPARPLPVAEPPVRVGGLPLTRYDGSTATVADILDETETDAFLVLRDGVLVHEAYGHEGAATGRHAVLSITKSVVGCVVAVLADHRILDLAATVSTYVPELAGTGYGDATLRHLLDMRSGVRFAENYTDPSSDINQLDRRLTDIGLRAYLQTLVRERPHGGPFRYRSSETDVLGWVCENATGVPMATLMSTIVWQPIGAERDAFVSCDVTGMAVHDGGLAASARDLARFGLMLLDGGTAPDPTSELPGAVRAVVPAKWLRDAWGVDADIRSAFAESPSELVYRGGWYRNQLWFRPGRNGDLLLCLGIHGQLISVCRRTRTVCVKLSHWPQPTDLDRSQNTIRACEAIAAALASTGGDRGRSSGLGLPGVAAGQRRGGPSTRQSTSTRSESR